MAEEPIKLFSTRPTRSRIDSLDGFTFARVGAAMAMKVEDFFVQGRRGFVRLHEKGGKEHEIPTHHNLGRYLEEYIAAAGIDPDKKGPLFRTSKGRGGELANRPCCNPTYGG